MRNNIRSRSRKNKKNGSIQTKKTIRALSFLVIIFALLFLFIFAFSFMSKKNETILTDVSISENQEVSNEEKVKNEEEKEEPSDTTFTMAAIGDVMCHNTQYWDAYNKDTGLYDFSYVYEDIKNYVKIPDIAIGNLETSFAGEERGYSNYPIFNSPDNLAYSLKKLGLDVISTAGNHSLDMGFSGLSRTIDVLDDADISHLGTYKTQAERDKVLFKYVKGVKIAFINYTYGTNGIPVPSDKQFCVNLIDKDLILKDIESAKSQNADMIVACMHWGVEYRTTANQEQKDLADFLFKNGVNVILGNHPHVLEQMEKREVVLEDGSTKEGFVIYALGNFICDQNAENTRNSIILNLTITKHTDGEITIDKANYTPIYMYKDSSLTIKKMKLLDIEKEIEDYDSGIDTSIGQSTYTFLKQQLTKITSIVGEEF